VSPVRYEHHLGVKSKAISVTDRGRLRRVSCEVRTTSTYIKSKVIPVTGGEGL
jgi:hypothetical protein